MYGPLHCICIFSPRRFAPSNALCVRVILGELSPAWCTYCAPRGPYAQAAAVGDAGQAGMESTTAPSADAAPGEVPSSSLEMDQELNPPAKRASRPTTPRQFAKVVPL